MRFFNNKNLVLAIWILVVATGCAFSSQPTSPGDSSVKSPELPTDVSEQKATEEIPTKTDREDTAADSASTSEKGGTPIENLVINPSYIIHGKDRVIETDDKASELSSEAKAEEKIARIDGEAPMALCAELGAKLSSVSEDDCLRQELIRSGATSLEGRDLALKDYSPVTGKRPLGRVLVIGGIHGDEFSSVSVVFKWMDILNKHHSGLFHWRIIPSSNPDGLLGKRSQRQNANGVDLNRNFPTADWNNHALDYWKNKAGSRPRRYPGNESNSEPETKWLVEQIKSFDPDVIISMHAPYHLVDYDGPPGAPRQLGSLYLRKLGTFPGSLGNYAGVDLELPIVTVELASAGIMPSDAEISNMWDDLIRWLRRKLN